MTTTSTSTLTHIPRGVVPDLHLSVSPVLPSSNALIVPVVAGSSGPEVPVASQLGTQSQLRLWKAVVNAGITGKAGETALLPATEELPASRVITVGLGPAEKITGDIVRQAAGNASRTIDAHPGIWGTDSTHSAYQYDASSPATPTPSTPGITILSLLGDLSDIDCPKLQADDVLTAAVEGHSLGAYRYSGWRTSSNERRLVSVIIQAPDLPSMPQTFTRACTIVEAVTCARDLVNASPGALFPDSYSQVIADLARSSGIAVEILDEHDLNEQGFGGLTGVGQGSANPPRLVRMRYRPEGANTGPFPRVALVGKGVTFDTGGISLKKPAGMDQMISDMGGSAAVVATVLAAAELELPVEVTATLPLAENMPDGKAIRPGDILHHYGGTTTEILNTDAEGRLILGDAIASAVEDDPDLLVVLATLTGAQMVALGDGISAVMGTPTLRQRLIELSAITGEHAWPMPLPADIAAEIQSDVADLRNTGTTRWGGMAAAGQYLSHFVPKELPWAHMDIAGPAYSVVEPHGYTPKRGTGVPVRTLIALLEDLAASP